MARSQAKPKTSKAKIEPAPAVPGLRERKRQQTRERLTRMAMALFRERGFEATTLDDIAAAADISRRSFFHYFASKEDVVFAWQEEITAALVDAVAARPAAESMLTAAENAILAMVRQLEPGEAIAMAQLKRDNPALQARAEEVAKLRGANKPTIPSLLGEEKKANVFLRADDPAVAAKLHMKGAAPAEVFAELRERKNKS